MTTIDRPYQRTSPILYLLLALVAASVLLALLPSLEPWVAHVAEKRGSANVDRTRACRDDGSARTFYNPVTGRTGKVCLIDGTWFVVILDAGGRIITGFPKEKMANFEQVVQYMKNAGYTLLH